MKVEDVVIIGAGPAGIAAAIQLKRFGLDPVVLEKSYIGGLLVNANLVENYPGFPLGIPGLALAKLFEAQLECTGVSVSVEEVMELDHDGSFILKTSRRELGSRFVVVASGTHPKTFEGIETHGDVSAKVFHEVYPIADVQGKKIAIIGAGDAAFDYALNLSRENSVSILNRTDRLKCLPLLWERAARVPRIIYSENVGLSMIANDRDGLVLSGKSPAGAWGLEVDYAIFAIGRKPHLDFLSERLKVKAERLESEGLLHFVGDVKNDIFRQTSIAVGDGVRAAMRICQTFRGDL